MFAVIKDGAVLQVLQPDTAFSVEIQVATDKETGEPITDMIQKPSGWLRTASPDELAQANIVPVEEDSEPDQRYYWVDRKDIAFIRGAWRVTFSAKPKDLADLKAGAIAQVKQSALLLLTSTDHEVLKAFEGSKPIPTDVMAQRAAIRKWNDVTIQAINSAADVEALIAVNISYST